MIQPAASLGHRALRPPRVVRAGQRHVAKRSVNAARAKRRTALEAQLHERLGRLDRRARAAVLTVLEIVAGVDRPRATHLVEAIGTIVAFATRGAPRER